MLQHVIAMATTLQLDILKLVSDLSAKRLYDCTAGILVSENSKNVQPTSVGSGTCVTVNGRFFICTAGHVIENLELEQIRIVSTDEYTPLTIPLLAARAVNSGELDVGYLELDAPAAKALGKTFVDVESILLEPKSLDNEVVVIVGFPSEDVKAENLYYTLGLMTFVTIGKEESKWGSGIDRTVRFELNYPDFLVEAGKSVPIAMPKPKGVSGGGIWVTEINDHKVWHPGKAKLAGIQQCWIPSQGTIRANWMNQWLPLVSV